MSDHGLISSYEGHKERQTGKIRGASSGMHRALDGWMMARAPAPPPWTSVFQFLSLFFFTMCAIGKLGFVDQTWLERNFSSLLPRTLVVGRRQQSESIEAALDNME